jgi:phosphoribosylaminoimidazolecarboxamide formyltransferase/IMP cyclohydrolase
MIQAFAHTAEYDTMIAATLMKVNERFDGLARTEDEAYFRPTVELVDRIDMSLEKIRDLRYGENPHQKAAWYREVDRRGRPWPARAEQTPPRRAPGFGDATIIQGKELSYTNLLDLDAAARIVLEFDEPAAVVVKHTNPCGAATGSDARDAYVRARDVDALSAFGGIVALNRPIDRAAAEAIVSTFIEAVVAPSVDDAARDVLAKKANMRVVVADLAVLENTGPFDTDTEFRSILGAVLMQERDRVIEARQPWSAMTLPDGVRVATKRQPMSGRRSVLRGVSARM